MIKSSWTKTFTRTIIIVVGFSVHIATKAKFDAQIPSRMILELVTGTMELSEILNYWIKQLLFFLSFLWANIERGRLFWEKAAARNNVAHLRGD